VGGSHFVSGLVVIVGTTAACTTTHVIRPLGRGNTALNASLGGPLVELGSVVTPVPIPRLYARRSGRCIFSVRREAVRR
jgi:hypothetical protein